jgi:hypothetical protein
MTTVPLSERQSTIEAFGIGLRPLDNLVPASVAGWLRIASRSRAALMTIDEISRDKHRAATSSPPGIV